VKTDDTKYAERRNMKIANREAKTNEKTTARTNMEIDDKKKHENER